MNLILLVYISSIPLSIFATMLFNKELTIFEIIISFIPAINTSVIFFICYLSIIDLFNINEDKIIWRSKK